MCVARTLSLCSMLAAGTLILVGLTQEEWWTTQREEGGVVLSSSRSLWRIVSEELAMGDVPQAGSCDSSDDCERGLWCRSGDQRCWTDSECSAAKGESGVEDFCAKLPRNKTVVTLFSCSRKWETDAERSACNRVLCVRALSISAGAFALMSALVAAVPRAIAGVLFSFALTATGCASVALWIAAVVDVDGARLGGVGVFFYCLGLGASALGTASALQWWLASSVLAGPRKPRQQRPVEEEEEEKEEVEVGERDVEAPAAVARPGAGAVAVATEALADEEAASRADPADEGSISLAEV